MFGVKDEKIVEFAEQLKEYAEKAYPWAVRETLNNQAKMAASEGKGVVQTTMVERNRWTRGSIQFNPTRLEPVNDMETTTGSTEDYMEDQEFGFTRVRKGKHGVPIPTSFAAGQKGAKPRTKLVRARNKLPRIVLSGGRHPMANKKQELIVTMLLSLKMGRRYFFFDFGSGKRKGIMRIQGGSRKQKRGWPEGAELDMVYDMTHESVKIPKSPWLDPAVERTWAATGKIYQDALIKQLMKRNLFK